MGLHYHNLTPMWSSFLDLVEVSNKEYYLRLELLKFPTKTISQEEKVDCSFLDHVPRKRRSSLTDNISCKKAKVSPLEDVKITPVWLDEMMRKLKGGASDPKLIFEKTLYQTDIDSGQSRLSLPFNKLVRTDFLTLEELRIIEGDIDNKKKTGVRAFVVDQRFEKWTVMLKRWELKKKSGKGSWSYALTRGWNEIVKTNRLRVGDRFSIWSFRWCGVLCFALVPPPPPPQ